MSNWWHATVHWVAIVVGVGLLSFPSDLAYLGWWPGMLLIGICWFGTLHSLWKMIQLHDDGARTFADLGRLAWGTRGAATMKFLQVLSSVSVNISYLIVGGYSVHALFQGLGTSVVSIVIFAALQIIGSIVSSLTSLVPFSAVSLLATIGYVVIIIGLTVHARDTMKPAHFSIPKPHRIPKTFNAMGNIGFAFSGHYLAMEVQSSLPCANSAADPMWKGILVSYIFIAVCYFSVVAIGYWTFGNLTCYDNILGVLRHPGWASKLASGMLIFHLTISYQIRASPIYESLELLRKKSLYFSWIPYIAVRSSLVAFTCFFAVMLPFFDEFIGITGGIALVPSAFIMPHLIWSCVRKSKALTPSWLLAVAWIAFGIVLAVLAVVGSMWNLIDDGISHRRLFHLTRRDCSSSQT